LVGVGLWVRLKLQETPVFQRALAAGAGERLPILTVLRHHPSALMRGTLMALCTFVLFYLMTVFTLTWGTTALHFSRERFLLIQLFGMLFFGLTIPISAHLADRHGRRRILMAASGGIALFGLMFAPLLGAGDTTSALVLMAVGLALMGFTYGPLGTVLSEQFPTSVRYTGASLSFNLAGIFGASLAPYIATWLATQHGLHMVGLYLSGAALLTLLALRGVRETMHDDL
jgi:MFS family permease